MHRPRQQQHHHHHHHHRQPNHCHPPPPSSSLLSPRRRRPSHHLCDNASHVPLALVCLPLLVIALLTPLCNAVPAKPLTNDNNALPSSVKKIFRPTSERQRMFKLSEDNECGYVDAAAGTSTKRTQAQTFLMVFMGHSGSSAIMSELWQHPKIMVENPEAVDHPPYQFNTSAALWYTRDFFQRGTSQGRIPGFKIRPWHILHAQDEWRQLVSEFNTRIIWQYRRNMLKQTVGEYSYQYYNDSSILEGFRNKDMQKKRCEIGIGCKFPIEDYDFFHRMLRQSMLSDLQITNATSVIAKHPTCVHELRYEDYLYHREGTMLDLYHYLGLDPVQSAPERFKATSDNMCSVVTNWVDLCRNFYGCRTWRPYFEDSENACSCPFSSSPAKYCDASPW